MLVILWYLTIHCFEVYINNKKPQSLLHWLKLIHEIKPTNERILRDKDDEIFSDKESQLNYKLEFILVWSVRISSVSIALPYFINTFQLNRFIFYPLTVLHYILLYFFFINFARTVGTLSLPYLSILKLFIRKFKILSKKLESFKKNREVDNQKLNELIFEYKSLTLQLVKANEYWKYLTGINFLYLFSVSVIVIFLMFSVNQLFRLTIGSVLGCLFVFDIFIPYHFSSFIHTEMQNIKNLFLYIQFKNKTGLNLKRRINSLILDNQASFTCFDIFELNAYYAFQVNFWIAFF